MLGFTLGLQMLADLIDPGLVRTDTDPGTKETPQLNSMIYSVQVNPIWNIPASIARKEISRYAHKFFLKTSKIGRASCRERV